MVKIIDVIQTPDNPPKARLALPSGAEVVVNGCVLEAQVPLGEHMVLFLTEDCPFEEALNMTLVNTEGEVLDSLTLSAMYATGVFELVEVHEHKIKFNFFEGHQHVLEVAHTPDLGLRARLKRLLRFGSKGHMKLKTTKAH